MRATTTWAALLAVAATALAAEKPDPTELGRGPTPKVSAASAIVLDAETGKVLWEKDADTLRFPASTTKVMTALLLAERTQPDDVISTPKEATEATGASLRLKEGEQVTSGDMLYALLLRSANDGCVAVAHHIAGSVPAFVDLMNQRALELGAVRTRFHNPHGLNDDLHLTTARDLALITRAALLNPRVAEAARTPRKAIWRSVNMQDHDLRTKNKFLEVDPTATGVKTGWTVPAGRCFIGSASREGMQVVTVVLKSDNWLRDTVEMTEWAYRNHERVALVRAGDAVGQAVVRHGRKDRAAVRSAMNVWSVVRKSREPREPNVNIRPLEAPVDAGQVVAGVVRDAEGFALPLELKVAESVPRRSVLMGVLTPGVILVGLVGGGFLAWRQARARNRRAWKKRRRFV